MSWNPWSKIPLPWHLCVLCLNGYWQKMIVTWYHMNGLAALCDE